MAQRNTSALKVADDQHLDTLTEVEKFAKTLPKAFLQCRELGHNWLPYSAGRYKKTRSFIRKLRCSRCKTKKVQTLSERGMIGTTHYEHPEGYLHKGHGHIVGEGRGLLRLESMFRGTVNELDDEDED